MTPFRRRLVERIARLSTARPPLTLLAVAALTIAAALAASNLKPSAAIDSLVDGDSQTYRETSRFASSFGGDPIVILVQGDLPRLTLGPDLGKMLGLEGCLSGNVPAATDAAAPVVPPVCRELARLRPAQVVYGPGTFVNTAVESVARGYQNVQRRAGREADRVERAARALAKRRGLPPAQQDRLAREARRLKQFEVLREIFALGLRYGIGLSGIPSLDNPDFVARVVFDPARGAREPKSRFAYLFPSSRSALIQMRLRPDLTAAERARTIALTRRAVAEPRFQLENGSYVITGVPVVLDGLQSEVSSAIPALLIAALVVMAIALLLAFSVELRLLPLALALTAAALTFGATALLGLDLTIASIAVLPVIIGLCVDYAVQFQSRFDDRLARGTPGGARRAVIAAAGTGSGAIRTAALATVAGLAMLTLSPTPLVRSFGVLLICGIAIGLVCVVTAGFAALAWAGGAPGRVRRAAPTMRLVTRLGARRAFGYALARPTRVLAVGAVAALLGLAADARTSVVTDIRDLVPGDLPVLTGIDALQRETGVSGEIDVVVRARDVTEPAVVAWMGDYQRRVLRANGYKGGEAALCRKAALCPALALTDLFTDQSNLDRKQIRALLKAVPPYFAQAVVTPDRTAANMAFGIRLGPLDRQKEIIDGMRGALDPPRGVDAQVVGVSVLAADANAALSSDGRRLGVLALALLAVFLVLLAVFRAPKVALAPVIPVALAAGWSALVLYAMHVELNPMSAALGTFVVAITAEFSVLLYMRFRAELGVSSDVSGALRRAYRSTGAAVLASGVTAVAGFGALAATDIRMLRDFAVVAVVDLVVSLAGALIALPAAVVWLYSAAAGAGDSSSSPEVAAVEPNTVRM